MLRADRSCRFALVLVLVTLHAGCGGTDSPTSPAGPSPQPSTYLNFSSEAGEYVGDGQTVQLTPSSATITAVSTCDQNHIEVRVRGTGQVWDLHLAAPRGSRVTPGTYDGARDWPPVNQTSAPAMAFYGNGRSCSSSGGRFIVSEVIVGPDGGIERFRGTFEQKCVNFIDPASWPGLPTLRGEVRLTAVAKHLDPSLFCR
jgi:hypothetical protein